MYYRHLKFNVQKNSIFTLCKSTLTEFQPCITVPILSSIAKSRKQELPQNITSPIFHNHLSINFINIGSHAFFKSVLSCLSPVTPPSPCDPVHSGLTSSLPLSQPLTTYSSFHISHQMTFLGYKYGHVMSRPTPCLTPS